GPRLDDRHAVALPPRNSGLPEEAFHASVLDRPERRHAITGTPPPDDERPGEQVGVEGDTPRVGREGAGLGGTQRALEHETRLRQVEAPRHGHRAARQGVRGPYAQAQAVPAHLDAHPTEWDRTGARPSQRLPQTAMGPRAEDSPAPEARGALAQDLRGDLP